MTLLALLVVTSCGSERAATSTTSVPTTAQPTTLPTLAPVPGGSTTTTPAPTVAAVTVTSKPAGAVSGAKLQPATSYVVGPAATAPATTTTTIPPGLTAAGAILVPPAKPSTRKLATKDDCTPLLDPHADGGCGTVAAKGGNLYWLVKKTSGGGRRAQVYKAGSGQNITLVLQAVDTDGSTFGEVRAVAADVSGDGSADIAFGFHRAGAAQVLAVDVVEGPGAVTLHREWAKGAVDVAPAQLDGWGTTASGAYAHEVVRMMSGSWRVVASAPAQPSEVPKSQL